MAPGPKISLLKYVTGQLDMKEFKAAYGMKAPPTRRTVHKEKDGKETKPVHPSVAKGARADGKAATQESTTRDEPASNASFSAKQDARILEWKAANEGKPWKILADELNKEAGLVKERYKALKAGDSGGAQGKESKSDGKENTGKNKTKGDASRSDNATATSGEGNAQKGKDKGVGKGDNESKNTADRERAELVQFLIKDDEEGKWLRISSRLFDRTGENIHPDDLRESFGKK